MSGELVALASALLWALASVLTAIGAKRLHVLPLNMVRCLVSTLFFWTLLPFYGGWHALVSIPPSSWLWLVVSVLGLLVIGDTLFFYSLDMVGVSWAMPVASINPLWAVLMAWLFLGEPLSWSLLAGAVLVVAGIVLVSRTESGAAEPRDVDLHSRRVGLLLALAASVLWSIGQVALKPATQGISTVVANSVRHPLGALMLLALTVTRGRWKNLKGLDRKSWAIIVVASLIGTGVGSVLFIMAIQLAGAGRTSVLTSTSPLLALPFSMLWLGERPTRSTVVGTILTITGIGLVM